MSRWEIKSGNPYAQVTVYSWEDFLGILEEYFLDWNEFIYRGHRDSTWNLQSTFDRTYKNVINELGKENSKDLPKFGYEECLKQHLDNFINNCTGKRGRNPRILTESEWWALGQHFGLETPLLDWTKAPFIAAYFALENKNIPPSQLRTVWAFSQLGQLEIICNQDENYDLPLDTLEHIRLINCPIDENERLLAQQGIFTITPNGYSIEEFILERVDIVGFSPILYRIDIPEYLRGVFLKYLEAMNINSATIFPDLIGTSLFTNRQFEKMLLKEKFQNSPEFIMRLGQHEIAH